MAACKISKYFYNKDSKKIERIKKGASGGSSLGNLKLTAEQKAEVADVLQTDLHNMLQMFDENPVDVKKLKTTEDKIKGGQLVEDYMKTISFMQGRIDSAYASGAIGKDERNRLINDFILPASDYIEGNIEQLDQGKLLHGKLGYDRIKKAFNMDNLKGSELHDMQKQKLFAQNYYLDELNKIVKETPNLKSIFDIESMPKKAQQEIYEVASERALKRAQRWTNRPDIFFAQEFPQYYSVPFKTFGQEKALEINKNVAQAVYKARYEGINDKDLPDIAEDKMREYINNEARKLAYKTKATLGLQTAKNIKVPRPKNVAELEERIKKLGLSRGEFFENAYNRGMVRSKLNPNYWIRENSYDFIDLSNALTELELAKQLEGNKN